jgi:hypothetical protein
MARPRQVLLTLLAVLALQELALRWVFPLPDVEGFNRLAYAGSLAPEGKLPSMARDTLWWWSEPDGAAFTRRLNLYGFRGRDWNREPPLGRSRVLIVGDSFVEGLGAPDGATIPDVFAARARQARLSLEVLNLGAGGFQLANYGRLLADAVPWFTPDDVVLVVYMNDLYEIPNAADVLSPSDRVSQPSRLRPRLLEVLAARREHRQVPRRWHARPTPEPLPLNVEGRLRADSSLLRTVERAVEPDLAAVMKAGRLNPAVANLLARSYRVLSEPVDARPFLDGLHRFLEAHRARLWVAYVPSLNQVSEAYLPAQRRLSGPIPAVSMTAAEFQVQARQLGSGCAELGIPFLDLTPVLQRVEATGVRLYWAYDSHMNAEGYRVVGEQLFSWWQAGRGGG